MIIRSLFILLLNVIGCFCIALSAQVPINIQVQILKAEDARRYDKTLEDLIKSPNLSIRHRAALAAGRIGDERAIPALVSLLDNEAAINTAAMAAFSIGEIESINGADPILKTLADTAAPSEVRARAVEAAGKIAAANPKNEKSKQLGAAILKTLEFENAKRSAPDTLVVRLGLTAALRARPDGAPEVIRPFLAYSDPNVIADALNTLARLRAKNANRDARDLLETHLNAVVRANAARVLGAAEDRDAVDILIKAATSDSDERVRVSAIRSLSSLKDSKAAEPLLTRAEEVIGKYAASAYRVPNAQSELLELFTTLGRLLANTRNARSEKLFREFDERDRWRSPEASIATLRISGVGPQDNLPDMKDWRQHSTMAQLSGELADLKDANEATKKAASEAPSRIREFLDLHLENDKGGIPAKNHLDYAWPNLLQAYARFKPDDLEAVLREQLASSDVWVRATAAELLAEDAPSTGVRLQIENAFRKALTTDKHDNDAQLAMLDAMAKINKAAALDTIYLALDAPDYLVRKKALELLDDPALIEKNPYVNSVLTLAREKHRDEVAQYDPKTGTKLGQVLNTDADYRRALSRRNGAVKAIVTTEKGTFAIDFLPEDAPLTVDNFIKLARLNYFNGLEVHRVVPNFVMQDGDPRGDGNGGPGWSIRCEINMVPYERGAVGMALSGKDTGGSQWFVTHSPQPHLDGGYTVFGRVNETGMKVVDKIVRGDKIVSIKIVEKLR
jgi:cyclophilin family peptidyl-prolyl cis-trans isomerase/HEAT repeat protein